MKSANIGKRAGWLCCLPWVIAPLAPATSQAYVYGNHSTLAGVTYGYRVNASGQAEIQINFGEQIKYAKALGKKPDVFLASWVANHGNDYRGESLGTEMVANISFTSPVNQIGIEAGQYQIILPEDLLVQSSMNLGGQPQLKPLWNGATGTRAPIPAGSPLVQPINNPAMPVTGMLLDLTCDWANRDTSTPDMKTWCTITKGARYINQAYSSYTATLSQGPSAEASTAMLMPMVFQSSSIYEGAVFHGADVPTTYYLKDQYGNGNALPVTVQYNGTPSLNHNMWNHDAWFFPTVYNTDRVTVRTQFTPLAPNSWNQDISMAGMRNLSTETLYGWMGIYAWDEIPDATGVIWAGYHRSATQQTSWWGYNKLPAGVTKLFTPVDLVDQMVSPSSSPATHRYMVIGLYRPMITLPGEGNKLYPGELNRAVYPFRKIGRSALSGLPEGRITVKDEYVSELVKQALKGVTP